MILSELCLKIWPLYIVILIGYIAGKFFKIDKQNISLVLFYFIIPIVFFSCVLKIKIQSSYLWLMLIVTSVSICLSLLYLYVGRKVFKDAKANLIAYNAGSANTGYFGLPIALMLFNEDEIGVYMLASIGISLYDYTLGAYIISSGVYTKQKALKKVLSLPMLYTFFLALILNYFEFKLSENFNDIIKYFQGTYIVLGLMIIGISLANTKKIQLEFKFLSFFLSARYLAAPMLTLGLITINQNYFHLSVTPLIYQVVILLAIVPPATNTVIFASLYNCYPEHAAIAVFIGIICAMLYVPIMIELLI